MSDVDCVIAACSNFQRPYPAIAIEVQAALGVTGYAYNMNVACSSATFAIQAAKNAIVSGSANSVLVVNPEICTGHLNFRDRDSHFIFGDACTAILVEKDERESAVNGAFELLSCKLVTHFSNHIQNSFGFLNRCDANAPTSDESLFRQNGRQVFRKVTPMVAGLILEHLRELVIEVDQVARFWLHQANGNMNRLIAQKLFGKKVPNSRIPIILDQYANTSSAGSIIAFHKYKEDLSTGDYGVICSFGAGYSVGSLVVRRQ